MLKEKPKKTPPVKIDTHDENRVKTAAEDSASSKTGGITKNLRQGAEERFAKHPPIPLDKNGSTPEQILHELQVHQIELEMQNEALRESQEALEESRDRFADLYEFAPVGYVILTKNATIDEINLTGASIIGVERQKLIKSRLGNFVIEDDLELWNHYFIRVQRSTDKQISELKLRKGDGSVITVMLEGVLMSGSAEPVVRMAIIDITDRVRAEENLALKSHDLDELNAAYKTIANGQENLRRSETQLAGALVEKEALLVEVRNQLVEQKRTAAALQESEERYRLVADFTHDWEFWVAPEGKIQYISPSTERILGRPIGQVKSLEELLRQVVHPDDLEKILVHLTAEKAGGGPFEMEYRILLPAGETRWIHHVCLPVFNAKGDFLGTRGSNRDITERKDVEEELKRQHDNLSIAYEKISVTEEVLRENVTELLSREMQLNEALAEKEILLSEIHHRVKNNLTAFISLLALDGSYEETPAGLALKKDLQNRARTMALIHETLYKTHQYSNVDMDVYLSTLVEQVVVSYSDSQQSIRTMVDAKGATLDLARATPMGLIVNELVTNSLKYAFPRGVKSCRPGAGDACTIGVRITKENGMVVLKVFDNGIGLPAGFDLKSTQTLGLKLVNFLARHQLRAKPEVNIEEGTEFTIRFKE